MGAEWVIQEFGGVDLGDERRDQRLIEMVTALSEVPGGALSQAFPDEAPLRAATRFFDNDHFDDVDLLEEHLSQSAQRAQAFDVVYAPQDTTSANYQTLRSTDGLGRIGRSSARGLYIHSTLLVTPQRVPLGLIHQNIWARTGRKRTARERKRLPIEEKESFRWLQSLEALNHLAELCPETTFVSMTDREGDIYNMFVHPRGPNVELLIRATHNRSTRNEEQSDKVWDELRRSPVVTSLVIDIPKSGKRPARKAHLDVHFKKVTVTESKWMSESKSFSTGVPEVDLWVVLAEEKHPPKSVKKPIRWMLYSSRPITTAQEATEAVDAYSTRWVIEVWHKTLKSGLKIEEKQAKDADRLARGLTLLSVIAWRIQYIMYLNRAAPDMPCTVCFEEAEWKAIWCRHHRSRQPPDTPPGLRECVHMLCKLSGFMGRKNEGEPGVKRLSQALDYLGPMADMYRTLA